MERTFAMLKPDAVQLRHIGAIIEICEQQGFRLLALKMLKLDDKQAHTLYQEHSGRPYFDNLIAFSMSGPVVICVFEGFQAIERFRHLVGHTNPTQAARHTLRARFGAGVPNNAVHASDSPDAADREIALFFDEGDIHHPTPH